MTAPLMSTYVCVVTGCGHSVVVRPVHEDEMMVILMHSTSEYFYSLSWLLVVCAAGDRPFIYTYVNDSVRCKTQHIQSFQTR